jgi:hypothetical protein
MRPCKDCPYWYKLDCDTYPTCHYEGLDNWAPCECEDDYDYDDYCEDLDEYYYQEGEANV